MKKFRESLMERAIKIINSKKKINLLKNHQLSSYIKTQKIAI